MSEFEKWFKSLNENGRVTYFLGQEGRISEEAWNHQQAIIDNLKAQLNNMETCYIEKKKQVEELQGQLNKHTECIENLVNQKADYLDRVTKAIAHLGSFDLSQAGMNKLQRSIESALEALRGDND